jgi:hypothetical protein
VLSLILALTALSVAETLPPGYPLQGLGAIRVEAVEPTIIGREFPELSAAALQSAAEIRLKERGVPLFRAGRDPLIPGSPMPELAYLSLRVSVVNSPTGPRGYSVNLRLMEPVTLWRGDKLKPTAATWDGSVSGPADQNDLVQRLHQAVDRVCNSFASDYVAANPKRK